MKEKYGNLPVILSNSDFDLSSIEVNGAVALDKDYYGFSHLLRLLKDSFDEMDVKEQIDNQYLLRKFTDSLTEKYALPFTLLGDK